MAVNRNIKLPYACPNFTITSLLLITSIVTLLGSFAMKYEFLILFGNYFDDYFEIPLLILIAGSVLIFVDAFLGLLSLSRRWYRGIKMFLVCTTFLLVAMIALVAFAYVNLNNEEEVMYSRLEEDLKNDDISMEIIDTVQFGLKCCGYNNFSDWTNDIGKNIPQSCCLENWPCDTKNSSEIHSTGCYQAMSVLFDCHKWIIVIALAVLGLVEIVAISLSVIVCRKLSQEKTSERPATDNSRVVNAALPRIHNPLGHNSLSTVDNNRIYVRRPTQLSAELNYRSPHENFLRHQPQLRFDKRIMMPSLNLKNPHAVHPR